jgi:hypothetical protein
MGWRWRLERVEVRSLLEESCYIRQETNLWDFGDVHINIRMAELCPLCPAVPTRSLTIWLPMTPQSGHSYTATLCRHKIMSES